MTQIDERRAAAARRVPVATLIEVCSNDPGVPAFEAESVDISGRGMHVRTAYLPEQGDNLVCRLEHQGQEVIVEGVVAWRNPQARGGEFGIQFTALDSGSVQTLRELCGAGSDEPELPAAPADPADPSATEAGARVRLHIDGLGSPMKARVRGGGRRQVHVGSNLEFLKVGKRLEIEDVNQRGRRSARIDAVCVSVDPQTQVPQLIVTLRYEGGDGEITPEPSVVDARAGAASPEPPRSAPPPAGGSEASASTDSAPESLAEPSRPIEAARQRAAALKEGAEGVAKQTGAVLASVGSSAAVGVGRLFQGASAKITEYRKARAEKGRPIRKTAPPPGSAVVGAARRLRPQRPGAPAAAAAVVPAKLAQRLGRKTIGAAAAIAVLATVVLVLATGPGTPPPGADADEKLSASGSVQADVTAVDEQGNPVADGAQAKPAPGTSKGLVADVPLFGPTPMATTEPAPLGPPPDDLAASEKAAAEAVEDEAFEDAKPEPEKKAAKAGVKPEDVQPWGKGKVRRPTIHRLRLDAPGAAIQGNIDPTGFTVVIPGRKVMESAQGIAKRDKRIARVQTNNLDSGAQIRFRFRDGVPGYRVRLRKDAVEFLVSE